MKRKKLLSFLGIIACLLFSTPVSGAWIEHVKPYNDDGKTLYFHLTVRSSNDRTVSIDVNETVKSGGLSYENVDRTSFIYYQAWNGSDWGPIVPVLYFGTFNRAGIHDHLNPYVCWDANYEVDHFKVYKKNGKLDYYWDGWMAISKPAADFSANQFRVENSVLSREYSMIEWGWKGHNTINSMANGFTQHCLDYDTHDEDDAYNTDYYMNIIWETPSSLAGRKIRVGVRRITYKNNDDFEVKWDDDQDDGKSGYYIYLNEFTRKVEKNDFWTWVTPYGGTYSGIKKVTLEELHVSGAKIYYTLDGSEPTTSSTEYKEPILISKTTTLKYMPVYNDVKGYVQTVTYTINPIEYVDLGLPSGTIWATKNIGASKEEEYGDYFAWGEIEPKDTYTKDNYKWGKEGEFTKYQNDDRYELEVQDDAASMNWGAQWHMPTKAQFEELRDYCNFSWIKLNGVRGCLYTSKKDNTKSIFLPSTGEKNDPYSINWGVYLYTKEVSNMLKGSCWEVNICDSCPGAIEHQRWYNISERSMGLAVRPVMDPGQPVSELVWISGTPNKTEYLPGESFDVSGLEVSYLPIESSAEKVTDRVTWSVEPAVLYCGCKSVMVTATYDDITSEPMEIPISTGAISVDLGLSVQWANFNIGAITLTDGGNYYTCDDIDITDNIEKVLGSGWRLPTETEVKELQDTTKCTWVWYPAGNSEHGGVAGCRVTSKSTNNFIFLPAAGCHSGSNIVGKGSVGNYWTSATKGSDATYMCFDAYDRCLGTDRCSNGRVIRVVKK